MRKVPNKYHREKNDYHDRFCNLDYKYQDNPQIQKLLDRLWLRFFANPDVPPKHLKDLYDDLIKPLE